MANQFPYPLINAHSHAAMVGFRGLAEDMPLDKWLNDYIWPAEASRVNPDFVFEQSLAAIKEMKASGIKAFMDMYFFEEEVARAAIDAGMNAVIGEVILDFPTPSAKTPSEAIEKTEALLNKFKNHPLISVSVAPHSIYALNEKDLICSKELARKYNAVWQIHIAETKKEHDNCLAKHGLSPLAYLFKLGLLDKQSALIHCVYLSDRDIDLIAQNGASVVHCPLSNLKLGSGIAPIAKLIARGVNVALGTDGAASSNRLDIWEAGKFAALLQKGVNHDPSLVSSRQAIRMMTAGGLKALGLESLAGFPRKDIEVQINKENFDSLYHWQARDIKF